MNESQERLLKHVKQRQISCGECYYIDSVDDGYNFSGGSEWYYCKRYPPNAITNIDTKEGEIYLSYPNVSLKGWCGEFKPEESYPYYK